MSDYYNPPEETGVCPHCWADADGAQLLDELSDERLCGYCGATFTDALSWREARSMAREDAILSRAGL